MTAANVQVIRLSNRLELLDLRIALAKDAHLWQFELLTPDKLCRQAADHGFRFFNGKAIEALWNGGLLRADYVASTSHIALPGLHGFESAAGSYKYCDDRLIEARTSGYGGALSLDTDNGPELLFHPFRLYVLYHIARVFDFSINPTQYLTYPDGIAKVTQFHAESLDRWTATTEFCERFDHWNQLAELAITLEPIAFGDVFHTVRWRYPETEESIARKIEEKRSNSSALLRQLGREALNTLRRELGQAAKTIDSNNNLHVLLRLMSTHERLKLRGTVGASMRFLAMAEIIRRAAERELKANLPEEDEIGFGYWMDGARTMIYGTERIFDAPAQVQRDYLTSFGLDLGVKVRCYVEGDTELGALVSAVGGVGSVEFINLRGQVLEKRGKGLAFADSLLNDMKSHVFSIVLIDQDREDYVRVLRKAAKERTFFGEFYVSRPDVEFANFNVGELVEVVHDVLTSTGVQLVNRKEISELIAGSTSGRSLMSFLHDCPSIQLAKGEQWGAALMRYAVTHPTFPVSDERAGTLRPLIQIARLLVRAHHSGYLRSVESSVVDPDSGKLVRKS